MPFLIGLWNNKLWVMAALALVVIGLQHWQITGLREDNVLYKDAAKSARAEVQAMKDLQNDLKELKADHAAKDKEDEKDIRNRTYFDNH